MLHSFFYKIRCFFMVCLYINLIFTFWFAYFDKVIYWILWMNRKFSFVFGTNGQVNQSNNWCKRFTFNPFIFCNGCQSNWLYKTWEIVYWQIIGFSLWYGHCTSVMSWWILWTFLWTAISVRRKCAGSWRSATFAPKTHPEWCRF